MAKGNIGNLLQHFVGLRCTQVLVNRWNRPQEPILYVDCYSMAPWEKITGKRSEGFSSLVRTFPTKAQQCDLIAKTMLTAWDRHHRAQLPTNPRSRNYPNTAVLLRTAFPNQKWEVKLHDTNTYKRKKIRAWAKKQSHGQYAIEGDWSESQLIEHVSAKRPVFVMLDPYQVVGDPNGGIAKGGYLTKCMIQGLLGPEKISLIERPGIDAAPAVVAIFSYSDTQPKVSSRTVSSCFNGLGWSIERVKTTQQRTGTNMTHHVGWVVSSGLPTPILGKPLQAAWNEWSSYLRTNGNLP